LGSYLGISGFSHYSNDLAVWRSGRSLPRRTL
jgi:hypothetical protein